MYTRIEPLERERLETMLGILCAVVRNSNAWGKRKKGAKPEDFIPKYDREQPRTRTIEERKEALKQFTLMMGGKIVKKGK